MKVPKEIAEKVERYQTTQAEADKLLAELKEYFEVEIGAEGFKSPFIAEKPTGTAQLDEDEYCYQITLGEDWYMGKYYHKIEGSEKYVGYTFEI